MKQNKYIIVRNGRGGLAFKAGYVEFHRHLATDEELRNREVAGGGLFRLDREGKNVVLYGSSDDFGAPDDLDAVAALMYKEILERVSEVFELVHHEEADLSEYKIQYVDKSGETHTAVPLEDIPASVVYGPPGTDLSFSAPVVGDYFHDPSLRVSKHAGGRFEKKDAGKKRKSKRRAQRRARRR